MLGWRDGGRWCTYLGRIANIRTGTEPDMVALGGDIVAFQHHLVPTLAGGPCGELFGQVTAGDDDPTPVGWVRVVRDEIGTAAVGRLFTGIDPTPYRAGMLVGEWKVEASGVGWALTRVCWSLPPDPRMILKIPVP